MNDEFDEIAPEGNRIVGGRSRAVVEYVIRSLAGEPDAVHVDSEETGGDAVLLKIYAAPSDMGRIIGRRGRVIQAVRQIARAAGATESARPVVDVVE